MRKIRKKIFIKKISKILHFDFCFLHSNKGVYLPVIMLASTLFIAFATAVITLALSNVRIANLHNQKITSMSIAEAGINYYMWHLAHNNTDYCDGNTCTGNAPFGPFHHNYTDTSGNVLGTYDLYITPPSVNSNITTVKCIGKVNGKSPTRTIISTIGMPSYTKYTLLVMGQDLWVGPGEKITGTVHINHSGVYNEGEITGDASSTETTFTSQHAGRQPGVSGPGIFGGSKLFPVPAINTNQLDVDMRTIRDAAKNNGEGDYYNSSNQKGYHIVLKANNYDLYQVKRYDASGYNITQESLISSSHAYPAKGIIFCEDDVWVNGIVNNQKVTIFAADPEANSNQMKRIIIPDNVKYTSYNGQDKIGLITQTNILVTRNAPNNLEIDAAMIAKNGKIQIDSYPYEHKGNIRVYGSMAHTGGLLWTYDYGGGLWSGYQTTETIIDQNSVLNPPPKFPLTGSYAILSWREE